MKLIRRYILTIAILSPLLANADTSDVFRFSRFNSFTLEASLSTGRLNGRHTTQDIGFNAGYKNLILTGRLVRDHYRVFVNYWAVGYRYQRRPWFNVTVSGGITDLAVLRSSYSPSTDIIADHYSNEVGFCAILDAGVRLCYKGIPTPIGITGSVALLAGRNYKMPLFSLGIRSYVCPVQAGAVKAWKQEKKRRKKKDRMLPDELPKNIVRTKLLFGVWRSTFVEYERALGEQFSISVGVGSKYSGRHLGFGEAFMGNGIYLKGPEVNAGFYYRLMQPRGWWTFGVKGAYRHRENAHFWGYYYGDEYVLSLVSDDYLALGKVAWTREYINGLNLEFMLNAGMRWSYRDLIVHDYFPTYYSWLNRIPYEHKGWEHLMSINAGLNIGFGW